MSNIAIEFEHVSKQYRLGLVSTKTLSHDIRRFWITNILGKEDPYLKKSRLGFFFFVKG
jgi:lipopolysaccharide transport system ATP-binding protein